jgi:hypothetical protein
MLTACGARDEKDIEQEWEEATVQLSPISVGIISVFSDQSDPTDQEQTPDDSPRIERMAGRDDNREEFLSLRSFSRCGNQRRVPMYNSHLRDKVPTEGFHDGE